MILTRRAGNRPVAGLYVQHRICGSVTRWLILAGRYGHIGGLIGASRRAVSSLTPAVSFTFATRPRLSHLPLNSLMSFMTTHDSRDELLQNRTFQELAAVLQANRAGVHGDKMAENLIRFAQGRDLVAIDTETQRALYHERASESLTAVRFGKSGILVGQQEPIQDTVSDLAPLVEARSDDLLWIHPRLRD